MRATMKLYLPLAAVLGLLSLNGCRPDTETAEVPDGYETTDLGDQDEQPATDEGLYYGDADDNNLSSEPQADPYGTAQSPGSAAITPDEPDSTEAITGQPTRDPRIVAPAPSLRGTDEIPANDPLGTDDEPVGDVLPGTNSLAEPDAAEEDGSFADIGEIETDAETETASKDAVTEAPVGDVSLDDLSVDSQSDATDDQDVAEASAQPASEQSSEEQQTADRVEAEPQTAQNNSAPEENQNTGERSAVREQTVQPQPRDDSASATAEESTKDSQPAITSADTGDSNDESADDTTADKIAADDKSGDDKSASKAANDSAEQLNPKPDSKQPADEAIAADEISDEADEVEESLQPDVEVVNNREQLGVRASGDFYQIEAEVWDKPDRETAVELEFEDTAERRMQRDLQTAEFFDRTKSEQPRRRESLRPNLNEPQQHDDEALLIDVDGDFFEAEGSFFDEETDRDSADRPSQPTRDAQSDADSDGEFFDK